MPGLCNTQESWTSSRNPCLSCQLATLAFRNPFQKRLEKLIEDWLPGTSDSDDGSNTTFQNIDLVKDNPSRSDTPGKLSEADLINMRTLSYSNSFTEIRSRSSPEQNQCVIENITLLQQDFRRHTNTKQDFTSTQSISQLSVDIEDENLSPRKKTSTQRTLFQDDCCSSIASRHRPPLAPIDMNACESVVSSDTNKTRWTKGSSSQRKKQERMMQAKVRKLQMKATKL